MAVVFVASKCRSLHSYVAMKTRDFFKGAGYYVQAQRIPLLFNQAATRSIGAVNNHEGASVHGCFLLPMHSNPANGWIGIVPSLDLACSLRSLLDRAGKCKVSSQCSVWRSSPEGRPYKHCARKAWTQADSSTPYWNETEPTKKL